jgi:ABC-type multidrug transport system ATPase subunit
VNAALTFRGVVKRYGRRRALDGLDLVVPCGSIFGLVGSNGAGKTTAMAVSAGLLQASAGDIDCLGGGPFRAETHAGRVTLLPQDSRFPPHARVGELLDYYARLQGVTDDQRPADIEALLAWVHLQDRRRSPVRTLSHGMNRRLAIAQAFLGAPDLILLDEPLNGLDPREAARVRDLIRQRRSHQTIVISSHQLTDIEALCDEVAFIELGRLVRQDTLDRIIRRSHRLTYVLAAAPPVEPLRQAAPEVEWKVSADGRELTASYAEPWTADALNARLVPLLLESGAGLLAIQRGSDLESEYLSLTPPLPPPASVK